MSETPPPQVPDFSLNSVQRKALAAAMARAGKEHPPLAGELQVAETMLRFNCYACHDRQEIGGVPDTRNAQFKTTQKEMGDEGRIPPSLNGVGAKLTKDWLRKIFREGADDRPYMLTRMPKFGESNVGHLQVLWDKLDQVDPFPAPKIAASPRRVKGLGRMMSGNEVFGCIKCHTFKGKKALGVQSIDMTIMTKRLRHDWFHHYLVKPSRFRPRTRMPTSWPQGRSTLRDVLNGDTHQQIEAIWQYLADGTAAREPAGLNPKPIVLQPTTEAIIYRNFIEGAGPRAIAVGYPGGVNIAFDANRMRLTLLWQGKFIDASKHWVGRGPGFQAPLGDHLISLLGHTPLAALGSAHDEWPNGSAKERGFQFQGYRIHPGNRPAFQYRGQAISVTDFPEPVTNPKRGLKRTIRLERASNGEETPVYWQVVSAKTITKQSEVYVTNHDVRFQISGGGAPLITDVGGEQELRIPVVWKNGKAEFTIFYEW